ncbi:hypothetical protein CERZMDRAFT_107837 [Cercospora zeae-maydis SCOH1-5]|uniref:Uncharacterized protein n=1 Tax=Cercospora zeae-maydis SCOH1-5 TaxID=717836 RepID=A0A6A6F1H5_9PEZI|nr:hypothetical protein CERZMDRAFT_107837 [Cercospora zeae-maydis SCOH1-5]
MCQYYRWLCVPCLATNDVVARCKSNLQHQLGDPCARTSTLPLPADAPKLVCQNCNNGQYYRQPGNAAPTDPQIHFEQQRHLQSQPSVSSSSPHTGNPLTCHFPADHDAFWLNPALRFPDCDSKLRNYNEEREKVFALAARHEKDVQIERDSGGAEQNSTLRCPAWEDSWSRLRATCRKL